MVGGGDGAFIGAVHRMAAALDGQIELVCGAFSSDPEKSRQSAAALYIDPARGYSSYSEMFRSEAERSVEDRMDFVAIVTPNHLHFPIAMEAIAASFHIMCEKPATMDLQEALQLQDQLADSGLVYGLAHTYTGYPMVKEARQRVADGELGRVRKVIVEYPQGWLSDDSSDHAVWRLNAEQSGASCCMGDIGVHAANIAEYISGQNIQSVCADLNSVVASRDLDDDGTVLLRFDHGANGVLIASQICTGEENPLKIRVYGEKGGLEWSQQEPNTLTIKQPDGSMQILRTGGAGLSINSHNSTRLPGGHPEGYIEAFANLYRSFTDQVRCCSNGQASDGSGSDLPGIEAAVRGMAFIETVVLASASDTKWHQLKID